MKISSLAFIVLILFSTLSNASIVMFDLNFSLNEVNTLRKYGLQKNIKVFIFPERTLEDEKILSPLYRKADQLAESKSRCLKIPKKDCSNLVAEHQRVSEQLNSEIAKRIIKIDGTVFSRITTELSATGINPNQIIFSGHSSGDTFGGLFGHLSYSEIKTALAKSPEFYSQTSGIYLWGCYSGTLNSLYNQWRKDFPKVPFFSGYLKRSPLGIRDTGAQYLHQVLNAESRLISISDPKKLHSEFKRIPLTADLDGTALVGDIFISYDEYGSVSEMIKKCNSFDPVLYDQFLCYEEARPGCENPPANHLGPLRDLYNFLQINRHCSDLIKENYPKIPSPGFLIRLIYSDNIKANYLSHHRSDVDQFDLLMAAHEYDVEIFSFHNFLKQSRANNLELSTKFNINDRFFAFDLDTPIETLRSNLLISNAFIFFRMGPLLQRMAYNPLGANEDHCIPFSWVDLGTTEKDKCGVENYLLNPLPKEIAATLSYSAFSFRVSWKLNQINPLLGLIPLPDSKDELSTHIEKTFADLINGLHSIPKEKRTQAQEKQLLRYQQIRDEFQYLSLDDSIRKSISDIDRVLRWIDQEVDNEPDLETRNNLSYVKSFFTDQLKIKLSKLESFL